MATQKQFKANRRNARRSTGPRSEQGRARVGLDALTHGLTARRLVLPDERPEDLEAFTNGIFEDLRPIGLLQQEVSRNIADCLWRLRCVPFIETAIYQAAAEEASIELPSALIKILTRYSSKVANLSRHEAALTRRLIALLHEFRRLQETRAVEPVEAPEPTAVDAEIGHEEHIEPSQQRGSKTAPAKLEPDPAFSDGKAQVSFFITNSQKQQLRARGYSDDQIAKMRPSEAHKILGLA